LWGNRLKGKHQGANLAKAKAAAAENVRAWPADKVARRPVADLIPYARNARTHSEAQVAQIAASIQEWGWTVPVLIDEGDGIIAGHGRILAAHKLGLESVPVMVAKGWSEAQKRAYIIADNKLALNADWDSDLLKVELSELIEMGFELPLIGFDASELDKLLAGGGDLPAPNLADRFMIPPFSVLNAREGWWQDRKRAWIAMGIQSELGRGADVTWNIDTEGNSKPGKYEGKRAAPGGSPRPAADYGKSKARGDGAGRALASKAERNGAVPGGGGKTAVYRQGNAFRHYPGPKKGAAE
jgi:ParB-like chromosome segregation protein Spo0J